MTWLSDRVVGRLRATAAAPDLTGTRYRLVEAVGRGGMGAVFRVEDTTLGRDAALKVLDVPDPSGQLTKRLRREAHVMARLEHPGIVPVHEVGTLPDGRLFYVMKYIRGERLDRWLAGERSLGERLRLFRRICDPVAFAHAHGVIHRDLKPQNIMVGEFGELLILDWGVAKVLEGSARVRAEETTAIVADLPAGAERSESGLGADVAPTEHGAVLGTPGFMAPEQARGDTDRIDSRADVFALGAVLRAVLTGHSGGEATTVPLSEPRLQSERDVKFGKAPRALAAVVGKAMAERPDGRYETVDALADEVDRFLDGRQVQAYPESSMVRVGRFLMRHRIAVILLLAYIVVRLLVFLSRS